MKAGANVRARAKAKAKAIVKASLGPAKGFLPARFCGLIFISFG